LDKRAIEVFKISEDILMENAGSAVYNLIVKKIGIEGKKFIAVCGTGNNGGDGFVTARKIYSNGGSIKVFIVGRIERIKGSARKNYEMIKNIGIEIKNVSSEEDLEDLRKPIIESDVVIDALFGTGLSREITGIYRDVIDLVNKYKKIVVSVDIPSGIAGDTGEVMGIAVKADYTVTFGLPKIGNILYPGYDHCGELYVSYISYPPSLYNADFIKIETNDPIPLPPRNKAGHKGTFGKALFIAGSFGYFGAPYLSAMAFLKAGGGYSRLASPRSIIPYISCVGNEIVFIPLKETETGSISMENKDKIIELSEISDIVIIGPGLSLNEETQRLVQELLGEINKPMIVDGDGITAISKNLEIVKRRKEKTVLTPHLGEMSRLTGKSIKEIEKEKISVLGKITSELRSVIVLKGAHSLIGYPDGKIYVNMTGNSGMATPGSGDVLTGTIAAMYGLGLKFEDAVRVGVFIHGYAGDLAALDKGEDGLTARDILEYLPLAMKMYRERFFEIKKKYIIPIIDKI